MTNRQRHGRILRLLFPLLIVLFVAGCAEERAAYDALSTMMTDTVAADGPAVVLLVSSDALDEQLFARGLADWEDERAVRAVNHYRIGGVTKTFISTLVLQLVSSGDLSFDDTLADRLPQIAANFENSDQITIRDLLMMTSGLPDYRDNPDFQTAVLNQEKRGWHADEVIPYAYDLPAMGAPGGDFHYSNTNYLLLDMMMSEALEDGLLEGVQDRILDPLDMQDTYLEPTQSTTGGHIGGYMDIDGDGTVESMLPYDDGRGLADLGMISNALDLGKFAPALYERTLPGPDGRSLTLATVPMPNGDGYGLGIMQRQSDWGEMWGYASEANGFSSRMWYLPDYELTVVVLINAEDAALADGLVEAALATVLDAP